MICSFCGKSEEEIFILVAGPDVNICDECILECNKIVFDGAKVRVARIEGFYKGKIDRQKQRNFKDMWE